jgi:hypothetical protein
MVHVNGIAECLGQQRAELEAIKSSSKDDDAGLGWA